MRPLFSEARSSLSLGFAIAALAVLVVPGPAVADLVARSISDAEDDRLVIEEIRRHTRDFVAGYNSGDLDLVMTFYADQYVDVNLLRPSQTRAERREYFRRILAQRETRVEVTPEEIIVSGEYAFVRGTIRLVPLAEGGEPRARERRYMELVKRFDDGWKAIWGMDADLYPES